MSRARGMVSYIRDEYGAYRCPFFFEIMIFSVCGVRQNFYVFTLYRKHDLDDRLFDCSLTSVAAMQADDVHASFLFVSDTNGQHQEWLGSTTTNRHGVGAFDFATVPGYDQLVSGLTHACG